MPLQARAEATRRRILESAVDLFHELGYGETGLADVLQRAGVSKGAFYYHFDSKEAVAAAIIEEYSNKLIASSARFVDRDTPTMEGVIRASFESAAMLQTDKLAWVGNELMQGLSQISSAAARIYSAWSDSYITMLQRALGAWELRDGIDPADVAEGIWVSILGCHLLSGAIGDDRFGRLGRAWRLVLRAFAPQESLDHLIAVLDEASNREVAV